MTIILNGERLDVTIENEKNAFDVVEFMTNELSKKEIIITSIEIDGKNYGVGDHRLKDMDLQNIDTIKLEASTKEELVDTLLEECKKVLTNISADIKKNGFSHSREFGELFAWIKETIETINKFSLFNMTEAKMILSTIDKITDYINNGKRDENKGASIIAIIESLIKYIEAIRFKFSANYSLTRDDILEAVNDSIRILPEISEAFQTGKDREAFDKINKIISVLEICCVFLRKNYSSLSVNEKDEVGILYEDINALLTRILEAFENSDAVLLGDLLEYELPDKIESYKRIILKG
jgi:hypothetical protein